MRSRPRRALATTLTMVGIFCSLLTSAARDIPSQGDVAYWGYTTWNSFNLMRGRKKLLELSNQFASNDPTPVVATADRRYVGFLSDERARDKDLSDTTLVTIDLTDLAVSRIPCPRCIAVIPYASNGFYMQGDDNSTLVVNPAAGTSTPVTIRPSALARQDPALYFDRADPLASTRNNLFFTRQPGVSTVEVSSLSSDFSNLRKLDTFKESQHPRGTNGVSIDPTSSASGQAGAWTAVTVVENAGDCHSQAPTGYYQEAGPDIRRIRIDATPLAPAGVTFGSNGGYGISAIWSDRGGRLLASVETWSCRDSAPSLLDERQYAHKDRLAVADHGQWRWYDDPELSLDHIVRTIGDLIVFGNPECAGPDQSSCTDSKLSIKHGDDEERLTTNPSDVAGPWFGPISNSDLAISAPSQITMLRGYRQADRFVAAGGVPPYTWEISQLPPGLEFDRDTGAISGVPALPGVFSLRASAVDSNGQRSSREVALAVRSRGPGVRAISVAAGETHTCAVDISGDVWCWGENNYGQLGDGSLTDSPVPVKVKGLSDPVVAISASSSHTCSLSATGLVACWGENSSGQLGTPPSGSNKIARQTTATYAWSSGSSRRATTVSAGFHRTCVVLEDGTAECAGNNLDGALGDGTTEDRDSAVRFQYQGRVTAVDTDSFTTCVRDNHARVFCAGKIAPDSRTPGFKGSKIPRPLDGLKGPVSVVRVGYYTACALMAGSGKVMCWGSNGGNLGNGSTIDSPRPAEVKGLRGATNLAIGLAGGCAVIDSGALWCWGSIGSAAQGSFGIQRLIPQEVSELTDWVKEVSVGDRHGCAVTARGSVECWGDNSSGQLGDGGTTSRKSPIRTIGFG